MTIIKKPKRFTREEAILTSRNLNESERINAEGNPDDRWFFNYQEVDSGVFEIYVTDNTGTEIGRW